MTAGTFAAEIAAFTETCLCKVEDVLRTGFREKTRELEQAFRAPSGTSLITSLNSSGPF